MVGFAALPPEDVYATAKKIRFVLERVDRCRRSLKREPRILDFGCGNGTALAQYLIEDGVDYVGVDFHAPSLEYARSHFGGPRATFVAEVPSGARFDILIYSEVLEHLADPGTVLREHRALLVPGGCVLGSIPNGYGLTEIEKFVDRKLRLYRGLQWVWRNVVGRAPRAADRVPYNEGCGHVQFFTERSFRRMVQGAGLEVVELRNGSVMGADLSGSTFLRSRVLIDLNVRLADHLPTWLAATWHFLLVPMDRER